MRASAWAAIDAAGQVEVLHLERLLVVLVPVGWKNGPPSPTISGAYCGPRKPGPYAAGLKRRYGAMLTKLGSGASLGAEFLGHQRAERRILDRSVRQIAGAHQEGGPAVIAFLGGHRADDGHVDRRSWASWADVR